MSKKITGHRYHSARRPPVAAGHAHAHRRHAADLRQARQGRLLVAGSLGRRDLRCLRALSQGRSLGASAQAASAALPNTRLQMLLRGQNLLGYRHYSDDVVARLRRQGRGQRHRRVPHLRCAERRAQPARRHRGGEGAGKHAQGTICYTTSPVHTIDAFVRQARDMAAMGVDSLVIKDMAGLLTPYATGELVRALKEPSICRW